MEPTRICESCGANIPRDPKWSLRYYATRRFCDRNCRSAGRPDIGSDYTVTSSGCWEWGGHIDRNGYGKAYDPSMPRGRRLDWAHRVSYRRHVGPIPEAHELDHTCENTRCINPAHLEPVTRAEHAARSFRRAGADDGQLAAVALRRQGLTYAEIAEALGLASKTSAHDRVKSAIRKGLVSAEDVPPVPFLSDAERDDIRALRFLGVPVKEIAAWYGIHNSQVSRISNGLTSGHGGLSPRERDALARNNKEDAA